MSLRGRPTFGDESEAQEFVQMLERFERGEVTAEDYRRYRLSRGIYMQRQEGLHMVRVKIPQGVLTSDQLRALATLSERYSRGYGHVTTRQNLQFHEVKPHDVAPFLEEIARSGLTTREACSHTVRNVVGCAVSGVCAEEPFDTTPYAEAITRHFLRGPLGSGLPRKFKITASGCANDCARAAMNDLGIIARVRDGHRGFTLLAGGGTATLPRSALVVDDFVPAEHLLAACEAVLRVYNVEGNRKDLKKARLKWAIDRLGGEAFRERYRAELALLLAQGGRPFEPASAEAAPPPLPAPPSPQAAASPAEEDPDFRVWREKSVRHQKQPGFVIATVWLRLGDISASQLRGVAALAERHADGAVRTTINQNLALRWIPAAHLSAVWLGLRRLGLSGPNADDISDVVSCPGAETCAIAVTASRGAAQLVSEHLLRRGAAGRAAAADIKVSGCPNGCSQHHVASIGLQGGVRKLGERLVPQYHVTIGGGVDGGGARFGRLVAKVPARRLPAAVDRLIQLFEEHAAASETPRSFYARVDPDLARRALADLTALTEADAEPEDFVDLGSAVEFKVVELEAEVVP